MKLPEFAVKRPVTVTMLAIALLLFGIISLSRIGLDFLPEIEIPITAVVIPYPGADPITVEDQVTKLVEPSLRTVSGVDTIMANSAENAAIFVMEFKWGTDLKEVSEELRSLFDMIAFSLPEGASEPIVYKVDMNQIPLMSITVAGEDTHLTNEWLNDVLKPGLESVEEIGRVAVTGQEIHQIEVQYDPALLTEYNVAPQTLSQMLMYQNIKIPAGQVLDEGVSYNLRAGYSFESLDDIKSLVVGQSQTQAAPFLGIAIPRLVKLSDVADVSEVFATNGQITTVNGEPAIVASIYKASDANIVNASRETLKKLQSLENEDFKVDVLFNQSDFIEESINSLALNGIVGGVLAILVLLVFLRNWRTTIITAISIPFSVIVTFALMHAFEMEFNLISLGGLALGVGMLVDNSIVVLENIFRKQQEGLNPIEAAIEGTKEVGMAITASTLTTVVVFLPVLFMNSLAGNIFRELALTVSFSLGSSLLVALVLVPFLASQILRVGQGELKQNTKQGFPRLEERYKKLLDRILTGKGKYVWLAGTLTFVVLAGLLMPLMTFELLPEENSNQISVSIALPAGTPLEKTEEVLRAVEPKIIALDDVDTVYTVAGSSSEAGLDLMSSSASDNSASLTVLLKSKENSYIAATDPNLVADNIRDILKEATKTYPALETSVEVNSMLAQTGLQSDLSVRILGKNTEEVEKTAISILEDLEKWPEFTAVTWSNATKQPLMELSIEPARVLMAGQVSGQVAQAVRQAVVGESAGQASINGNKVPIILKAKEEATRTLTALEDLYIPGALQGQTNTPMGLRLGNVVEVTRTFAPPVLQRENGYRVIEITAQTTSAQNTAASEKLNEYIEKLELASSLSVDRGGMEEFKSDAYRDLIYAALLAIALVYMVMASQFEGLLSPFIIMVTLPLALIGSVLALFLYDRTLSIPAVLGMIILAGIVVNNGIVLVDYINQLRKRGMETKDAVIKGAGDRLRPILMTALTTILALLPQALSIGSTTKMQIPMGLAVMGGLITSTFLTLTIVPCIYYLVENRRKRG